MFSTNFCTNENTPPEFEAPYQIVDNLPLPPDIAIAKRVFDKLEEDPNLSENCREHKRRRFTYKNKEKCYQCPIFDEKPEVFASVNPNLLENLSFAHASHLSTARAKAPPQTPRKTQRRTVISPFEKLFKEVEKSGKLKVNLGGNKIEVDVKYFGKGTFMQVYTLESATKIYLKIENDQLLVKIYHGEVTGFTNKLPTYLANSLKSHQDAIELELPIAKIYNYETALEDGYLLVEKIPFPIDIQNEEHLKQCRYFLKCSFEKNKPFDLSFNNFGMKDDTVFLLDYNEKIIQEHKLGFFVIQYLKSWVKQIAMVNIQLPIDEQRELASKFLLKMTEGLDIYGFKSEWISEAINGQLPEREF